MVLSSTIEASARDLVLRSEPSRIWNEAESALAFLLLVYLDPARLGGTKRRADGSSTQHPAVTQLARIIGRTTNAVSWKVQNLRYLLTGGVRGASRVSAGDCETVRRYIGRFDDLWADVEAMKATLPSLSDLVVSLGGTVTDRSMGAEPPVATIPIPVGGTTAARETLARRGQGAFRDRVLANYAHRCAVCALRPRSATATGLFLRAGHIRPWAQANDHQRLDPRNGLSLCVTHDRAFEGGLFTLTDALSVAVAPSAGELFDDVGSFQVAVGSIAGRTIEPTGRDFERPAREYLDFHRDVIFGRAAWPSP